MRPKCESDMTDTLLLARCLIQHGFSERDAVWKSKAYITDQEWRKLIGFTPTERAFAEAPDPNIPPPILEGE